MSAEAIRVTDDVLPDPLVYRAAALTQPFGDLVSGPVVFHGLALIGHSPLAAWLTATYGLTPTLEFFRLSPLGQEEPSRVHTDRDMGDWTAILYLNPDPPAADGTTFHRWRATGAIASVAVTPAEKRAEWEAWRDDTQWEAWHTVPAVFNRLIVFPAPYFHSRAIVENWGEGLDGRLIQIAFGRGEIPSCA
jgi:hypothetical protein